MVDACETLATNVLIVDVALNWRLRAGLRMDELITLVGDVQKSL